MGTPVERLDTLIEQARLDLGVEFKELAALAGIAPETLRALRKTGKANALTKRRVEAAIKWQAGSIDAVLEGGEPQRATNAAEPQADELTRLRTENVELRAQVEEVGELRSELRELRAEIDRLRKVRKPDVESG